MSNRERFIAGEIFVIHGQFGSYFFNDDVIFKETGGTPKCEGSCTIGLVGFVCENSVMGSKIIVTTKFKDIDFDNLI